MYNETKTMKFTIVMIVFLFASIGVGIGSNSEKADKKYKRIKIVKQLRINEDLKCRFYLENNIRLQYMTLNEFKETLGYYESNCIYNIENIYGFKGKYQFSDYMIRTFTGISPTKFLQNKEIQEEAMRSVVSHYIHFILYKGYDKYINKEVGGVTVTLEGLLLGCHFSPLYLDMWLRSNGSINRDDGYITIGDYIKRFEKKGIVVDKWVTSSN